MNINLAQIWTAQIVQSGNFSAQIRLRPNHEDTDGSFGICDESDSATDAGFKALCDALKIKAEDYVVTAEWTELGRAHNVIVTITKGSITKKARGRAATKSAKDQALAEAMLFALKQI